MPIQLSLQQRLNSLFILFLSAVSLFSLVLLCLLTLFIYQNLAHARWNVHHLVSIPLKSPAAEKFCPTPTMNLAPGLLPQGDAALGVTKHLLAPSHRVVRFFRSHLASRGFSVLEGGRFLNPAPEAYISSPFGHRHGRFHRGADLAAPTGSPIFAAESGTVEFSGWDSSGYGKMILIRHSTGLETRYAHCAHLLVHNGQQVERGESIATIGTTGHATGPHLHFEVLKNSETVNPISYLTR